MSAVTALTSRVAIVDPKRVGIIGWSHGGMITLLSIFRNPGTFAAAVAIVPVANLFQRLAYKGVEEHRALIDPNNRLGGTPAEQPGVYRDRSPLFHVDKLRIPLRVHIADNDQDVNIEEGMQLVDALRARTADAGGDADLPEPAGRPPVRPPGQAVHLGAGEQRRAAGIVAKRLDISRSDAVAADARGAGDRSDALTCRARPHTI